MSFLLLLEQPTALRGRIGTLESNTHIATSQDCRLTQRIYICGAWLSTQRITLGLARGQGSGAQHSQNLAHLSELCTQPLSFRVPATLLAQPRENRDPPAR